MVILFDCRTSDRSSLSRRHFRPVQITPVRLGTHAVLGDATCVGDSEWSAVIDCLDGTVGSTDPVSGTVRGIVSRTPTGPGDWGGTGGEGRGETYGFDGAPGSTVSSRETRGITGIGVARGGGTTGGRKGDVHNDGVTTTATGTGEGVGVGNGGGKIVISPGECLGSVLTGASTGTARGIGDTGPGKVEVGPRNYGEWTMGAIDVEYGDRRRNTVGNRDHDGSHPDWAPLLSRVRALILYVPATGGVREACCDVPEAT